MLLTNGRIYTLDATDSVVDTLVVRDGRIAFAARRGDVNPGVGEQVIDLRGLAVLPGLVDAHAHLAILAESRLSLKHGAATSEDDVARMVRAAAANAAPGEWITGRGWDQSRWPDAKFPTRASLDRAAPEHPVALVRVDGHTSWVNGAALAIAGITRSTGDPAGGLVVKDASGEPTGLLVDTAQDIVRRIVPKPSPDRFDAAVHDAIDECVTKGLTGIHEMGADLGALAAYRRLVERGHFPFRSYAAVRGKEAWAYYRERGPEVIGDGRVVVGALKLWLDGALGSRGAALHQPYCDDACNTGLLLLPIEDVEQRAREAAARGFQICVHAIGDRANTLALDAFEKVLGGGPRDQRFRVEHAQVLTAGDIPRFQRLGVLPSMQPTHCISDLRWAVDRLGPDRLSGAYAWRSLLATGTVIAGGSDFPVEDANPFHGIHAAVTRRPLDSGDDPGWQPHQRMTRGEAVRCFTVWNAYASRQETELGTLEVGKHADLVVLSDDPFTCDELRIKDITPALTMIGGDVVVRAL